MITSEIQPGDGYIDPKNSWDQLAYHQVISVTHTEVHCLTLYSKSHSELREVSRPTDVFVSPFTLVAGDRDPVSTKGARSLVDLAASFIREAGGTIEAAALVTKIITDPRFQHLTSDYVENCLKCRVAIGAFSTHVSGRKKTIKLSVSESGKSREKSRVFAASFADELDALSARVRNILPHAPTLGTYRETLLQGLLRKSLPERYHIATGFIHGCERQIDVLIYDRMDHAPIFREHDLVVVPPEAVRAIIEVKTNLSTTELRSSLALLSEVSGCDDCGPPIFKGVFGFESAGVTTLLKEISFFYRDQLSDDEIDAADSYDVEEDGGDEFSSHIDRAYDHLTALAVPGKAFINIEYLRQPGKSRFQPTALAAESASNLAPQAALFLGALLSYLQPEETRGRATWQTTNVLGSDVKLTHAIPLGSASWGTYVPEDHDFEICGPNNDTRISKVQTWLAGTPWAAMKGE